MAGIFTHRLSVSNCSHFSQVSAALMQIEARCICDLIIRQMTKVGLGEDLQTVILIALHFCLWYSLSSILGELELCRQRVWSHLQRGDLWVRGNYPLRIH